MLSRALVAQLGRPSSKGAAINAALQLLITLVEDGLKLDLPGVDPEGRIDKLATSGNAQAITLLGLIETSRPSRIRGLLLLHLNADEWERARIRAELAQLPTVALIRGVLEETSGVIALQGRSVLGCLIYEGRITAVDGAPIAAALLAASVLPNPEPRVQGQQLALDLVGAVARALTPESRKSLEKVVLTLAAALGATDKLRGDYDSALQALA